MNGKNNARSIIILQLSIKTELLQCKTELLMHGIIVFDVKYGQHQWETVFRASRCHFHHRPALINQLYWNIKTVGTIEILISIFFFHNYISVFFLVGKIIYAKLCAKLFNR